MGCLQCELKAVTLSISDDKKCEVIATDGHRMYYTIPTNQTPLTRGFFMGEI